jgi:8-oxo-dGTP diphosphatase
MSEKFTRANVERNTAVPASYAIFEESGKILLGHRINTGYYDGYYTLPSGHIEAGELPMAALIREAKEEVGVDIKIEDVKLVHTMFREKHDETGQRADYFFEVMRWSNQPVNAEPDKCDDLNWFPIDQLPVNTMHHVRYAIECYKKGVAYSEIPFTPEWVNPNN